MSCHMFRSKDPDSLLNHYKRLSMSVNPASIEKGVSSLSRQAAGHDWIKVPAGLPQQLGEWFNSPDKYSSEVLCFAGIRDP